MDHAERALGRLEHRLPVGRHAPGLQDAAQAVAANHHLLLAHGLRRAGAAGGRARPAEVGITLNLAVVRPASPDAEDMAAELEARHNGVYLGPLFSGGYPDAAVRGVVARPGGGLVHDGDLETIAAPLDFLGVNYYFPQYVGRRRPPTASCGAAAAGAPGRGAGAAGGPARYRDGLAGRADSTRTSC